MHTNGCVTDWIGGLALRKTRVVFGLFLGFFLDLEVHFLRVVCEIFIHSYKVQARVQASEQAASNAYTYLILG